MTNETGPTKLDEFIALEGLAKSLGVSKGTVSKWRRTLRLPGIKLGGRLFFHEPAVAAWLKSQEQVVRAGAE